MIGLVFIVAFIALNVAVILGAWLVNGRPSTGLLRPSNTHLVRQLDRR